MLFTLSVSNKALRVPNKTLRQKRVVEMYLSSVTREMEVWSKG